MAIDLKGKNAIVTGGGSGIGRALAGGLAAAGARVIVNDLGLAIDGSPSSAGRAAVAADEICAAGGAAIAATVDVTDFAGIEGLVQECVRTFGSIDIVVNSAGFLRHATVQDMTEESWDAVLAVHVKGSFNLIHHASRHMIEQRWGRIVNLASGAGLGLPRRVNYSTAKAAVMGLTAASACDLGPFGITVNAINPGPTDTPMVAGTLALARAEIEARGATVDANLLETTLMPPVGLVPFIVYLCSDAASEVNGRVFQRIMHEGGEGLGLMERMSVRREAFKHGEWTADDVAEVMPALLTP